MFNKTAMVLVAALVASYASASSAADASAPVASPSDATMPLAPGKAAGVSTAQSFVTNKTLFVIGGLAILGTGAALLASGNGGHDTTTSTTSTGER